MKGFNGKMEDKQVHRLLREMLSIAIITIKISATTQRPAVKIPQGIR